jgi:uncharacterized protein DUF1206
MGERAEMNVRSVARGASARNRAVARTATNPTAVLIGRIGFVARGAVYLTVGWLALRAAVGVGTAAADKQGALEAIAQQPAGAILLGAVAGGLFAYAAWSLVRAVFDPERRGHRAGGLLARVGYAVAGLSYAGLAAEAAHLALGSGTAGQGSDASTQDWTARLLNAPFGPPLVIVISVIMLAVAATEFISAYTANFRKELSLEGLGPRAQRWVTRVGRTGLAARGVVFALIGLFLVQAARHDNAGEAVGLGGALQKLAEQSYGEIWLGVVAAGLFMYGLFSLIEARYRRFKR